MTQFHDEYIHDSNVIPFDASRITRRRTTLASANPDNDSQRPVAAVVTVTRFIAGRKIHAQVPVFADEIIGTRETPLDLDTAPELSELLADGAVEANAFLDRVANAVAARPFGDFCA